MLLLLSCFFIILPSNASFDVLDAAVQGKVLIFCFVICFHAVLFMYKKYSFLNF